MSFVYYKPNLKLCNQYPQDGEEWKLCFLSFIWICKSVLLYPECIAPSFIKLFLITWQFFFAACQDELIIMLDNLYQLVVANNGLDIPFKELYLILVRFGTHNSLFLKCFGYNSCYVFFFRRVDLKNISTFLFHFLLSLTVYDVRSDAISII